MDPLAFVGVPDWRSAVLAVLFAAPWLLWLGRGHLRSPAPWLALVVGAVVFPFAIAWVQVPIQLALNQMWSRLFASPAALGSYILVLSIPSLLVASAVQEAAKLGAAFLAMRLFRLPRAPLTGLALGAAAGAGFGGFEAFWAMNSVFSAGLTWATVQLAGPAALVAFVERFFAVPFHVGSGAINAYGYATGRTLRFWLLAVLLHTVLNYAVVLVQNGLFNILATELWVAVGSLFTVGIAIWLRRRVQADQAVAMAAK